MLNKAELKQKRVQLKSLPYKVTIDPGNFCNLRCPGCHTGIKHPEMIDPSFLAMNDFKTIFAQVEKQALSVALYNWGEPFLNKNLFEMIAHAEAHQVGSTIHSNFNHFNEKLAENAVKSGLTHIYLSIDGATDETYRKYRVKGNLNKVLENLKIMLETRKRLNSKYPIITWKYLVFEHNKHELEQARKMAADMGVDEFEVFTGSPHLCDIYAFADDIRQAPATLREVPDLCGSLWSSMYVNSDGTLFPCSLSFRKSEAFGNLLQKDLREVWNNANYQGARAMFGDTPYAKEVPLPCRGCSHYLKECGFVGSYVQPKNEIVPELQD